MIDCYHSRYHSRYFYGFLHEEVTKEEKIKMREKDNQQIRENVMVNKEEIKYTNRFVIKHSATRTVTR